MKQIGEFLRRHQSRIHICLLIGAVTLYALKAFDVPLSPEVANAIVFGAVAYILADISRNVHVSHRTKAYQEQNLEVYRELEDYLVHHDASRAVLIQYSGQMVKNLLRKLLSKGADVTLYLMHPESSVSQEQKKRIQDSIDDFEGELSGAGPGKLTVHYYEAPASVRAVCIDDKVLAMGWYTYEHKLKANPRLPEDRYEISGHDVAGFLLHRGSEEFAVCMGQFQKLFNNYEAHRKAKGSAPVLKLPRDERAA